ncbi:MAG: MFS transporter [Myxococcota bacterium]
MLADVSESHTDRLPLSRILFYSLPFTGYLAMSMPVGIWFAKFSTDELLIAPATIGAIVFLARAWDAVSDPMAGSLSDRTQARLGRRRSWLLASAIPVGLTYVMLWNPPAGLTGTGVVVWIAAAMLLWETTSTAFYVPYLSLGLELSKDYHDRTRLFGWRQALVASGFGASLGSLYFLQNAETYPDAELPVSVVTGVALALMIVVCVWRVPEPSHHQGRGGGGLGPAFGDVLRNPHARILLVVLGIDAFGMGSISALGAYMAEDVVRRADLLIPMMSTWMIPQFVCVPIWVRLSRRTGKKRLWLAGMASSIVGFFGILAVGEGDWRTTLVMVLLVGIGTSVSLVIGPSIQADVVDYDELRTGERKEGAYVAVWNFMRKAGAAVAMGLGLFLIDFAGYDPLAERQPERVLDAIRLSSGALPALSFLVGAFVFARFGLNEAEHRRLKAELAARP